MLAQTCFSPPLRWFIGSVFDSFSPFTGPHPPHRLSCSIISCVPRLGKTTGPIFPSTWFYVKHFRSLMIWLISLSPRAIFVRPPKRPRKTQFLWFLSSMNGKFSSLPLLPVRHRLPFDTWKLRKHKTETLEGAKLYTIATGLERECKMEKILLSR